MEIKLEELMTEGRNPSTMDIDQLSGLDLVRRIHGEDKKVAAAVEAVLPQVAEAMEYIVQAFKGGGRLIYMGAGTSGRLGILDAVECPPTYGTPPEMVEGLIAGGMGAIFRSVEGAEDRPELGEQDLKEKNLTAADVVVGIAASGRTPYVLGGMDYARRIGCRTVAVSCTTDPLIGRAADVSIRALVGAEAVTGSTRMKAGTAQKMILNMLTTGAMVRVGKVYSNLMVDVQSSNEKLKDRARRIVRMATGVSDSRAADLLEKSAGSAKLAIVMGLAGADAAAASQALKEADGFVAGAVARLDDRANK